jgi:uroporphyrin-3 C-methyltransferase
VSDTPDSDSYAPDPVALPPPPRPTPIAPSTRGFGWLAWVLLLALLAFAAWQAWLLRERQAALESSLLAQRTDQDQGRAGLAGVQQAQKTLETRLADANATNKVLREEVLAMGERASLLEDAVARLADNRLRGEVMLRLNEAEFLLLLGEERLRLFGDVAATIQAYTLAEAALAGLDDPVMATLRQTLAAELLALREVPVDPRPSLRADLAQIAARLPLLDASRAGAVAAADANDSRLVRLLSSLVTVRRVSERDAMLGPVQRETALAALRLQLELAQAALARPDVPAFRHAIDASLALAAQTFDARAAEVARTLERLRALRETTLVPELPALGATLSELRGLRATRSVGGLGRAPQEFGPDPATAEDSDVEGGE